MALTGTYERNLDDKLRLALPKRLRDDFGDSELTSFFIAPGIGKSLDLYSPAGFERLARKFEKQPTNQAMVLSYMRLFYAQSERVDIDGQGRIRIPERLATLAGLKRDVVLLGVHDHVELWDSVTWRQFLDTHSPDFDQIALQAFQS
ncbi:MAG: cell division protein [Planctomycetales bacterium]